jgi:hypothetical protein
LEAFEAWREPTVFDFEGAVGADLWEQHWKNWQRLFDLMHECERTAIEIRQRLSAA